MILRETNGFNVSNGATRHRGFEYEAHARRASAGACPLNGTFARHEYAFSRAIEGGETIVNGNDVDTAPRNLHSLSFDVELGSLSDLDEWRLVLDSELRRQLLPRRRQHRDLSRARRREPAARRGIRPVRCAPTLRVDNLFDKRYADRADFAFGNYRYFPARGRAVFLSVDYASN